MPLAVSPAWADKDKPLACASQGGSLALPYASVPPAGYDHDRFATRPLGLMFREGAFTSSFETPEEDQGNSPYKGLPKWVSYEMHALMGEDGQAIHPQGAKRPPKWYELERTSFVWTDRPDVRKKGIDAAYRGFAVYWNRGHMAARNHANRISWQEGCNTHVFINALPQFADMNQGDWLALENYSIAVANRFGRVWTMAGPVFDPELEVDAIGKDGTAQVSIPHAVFKILAIERAGKVEARAFLFPQADEEQRGQYRKCAGTPQSKYDLSRYATTVAEVEKLTGLKFFTSLTPAQHRELNAGSGSGPWEIESRFYADRCGGEDDDEES